MSLISDSMQQETFKTQIIAKSRATIPARVMKLLKLKEGDWVEIVVKKVRI